jgi:hypothetical protein
MRKRFVLMGIISAIALSSCERMAQPEDECRLYFNFARPYGYVSTKAAAADTNNYLLTVRNEAGGEPLYSGPYAARPQALVATAGTYVVSVESGAFDVPAFSQPQYGDRQKITVSPGSDFTVSFICTQLNAGIRVYCTEAFKQKYGNGSLVLRQAAGSLEYGWNETRTAYFQPSDVDFVYRKGAVDSALFNLALGAREVHNVTLDISQNKICSTITVDTLTFSLSERLVDGGGFYYGYDGSSLSKALPVSSALNFAGDTVWVWGYIVGEISSTKLCLEKPFTAKTNIAISENLSAASPAECFSVGLPSGAFRDSLSLSVEERTDLLFHRKVYVRGAVDSSYLSTVGMRKILDYYLP